MSEANCRQRSVLVVDDIADNRILLERSLRSGGYQVRSAQSGQDAICMMRDETPDIVLLDWMMPGLSGLETLIEIRKDHPATLLPVIMCTAIGEEDNILQAIEAGANDYVTKPISLPILRARMAVHLSQSEQLSRMQNERQETKLRAAGHLRRLMEAQASR